MQSGKASRQVVRERVTLIDNIMGGFIGSQRCVVLACSVGIDQGKNAARVAKEFVACEMKMLGFLGNGPLLPREAKRLV